MQQGKKARYSHALIAVGIVVLLVCAISVLLNLSRQSRTSQRLTVKEVQRQIDGSIPIGSTRVAVESYLDSRSIPHSYVAASGQANGPNVVVALITRHFPVAVNQGRHSGAFSIR